MEPPKLLNAETSTRPSSTLTPAHPSQNKRRVAPTGPSRRRNVAWESDSELVQQILAGSREHFEMLYEAYFPRVYRFALKRMRDTGEAEDVTQEVFVTVFRALKSYQGNSSLLVWIFGIARNKVNRRFRGARPWMESIDPENFHAVSKDAPADEQVQARILLAQCEDAIENRLTPLQRRIFQLKHLRRQSIRSIAEALGKSEDAVKANLYRMRRAIAQAAPGLEQVLRA
jgi:RNA polymerase sigma-70 factor (ECF subfamily)